MKILNSSKQGNVIFLEVEQSPEAIQSNVHSAFKKLSKDVRIPGFRKGKVPRSMFEKHFGRESILREGVMDAVNAAYSEAIRLLELKVIDYPRNLKIDEYEENRPVKFSCEIDVLPEVNLGQYKGIAVTVAKETVDDAKINEEIDRLRESYATFELAEREARSDDVIRANLAATIDGQPFAPWTREGAGIRLGLGSFGSEFDGQVIGMKAGDSKSFSVALPDDFPNREVAGKLVEFSVALEEVREKQLPELNDEFAAKVSQFSTAEALVSNTRERLENQAEESVQNAVRNQIIEAVVKESGIEVQGVLIDREVDQLVREFDSNIRRIGYNMEQYLQASDMTVEKLRESYRSNAESRVKADLVLNAIADAESISVSEDDLIAEILNWNAKDLGSPDAAKRYLKKINQDGLRYAVRRQKTLDFVVKNAVIS